MLEAARIQKDSELKTMHRLQLEAAEIVLAGASMQEGHEFKHAAPEHKADRGSPLEAMHQQGFALRREAPAFVLGAGRKTQSIRRTLRRRTAAWHMF